MGIRPVFSDYIYEREGVFGGSAMDMPIAVTREVGHGTNSKAIIIGGYMQNLQDANLA